MTATHHPFRHSMLIPFGHILLTLALLMLPSGAQALMPGEKYAPEVPSKTVPASAQPSSTLTPEQEIWKNASPEERRTIGEEIGENGARGLAQQMGLEPLFDGTSGKTIPQGPDQVYRAADNTIHVFESKANSSPLNAGYGYIQGTIEHTIKSAEYVLTHPKASPLQKKAAMEILRAAAEGRLKVSVVRTNHVFGKIVNTIIEKTVASSPATQELARQIIAELAKRGIYVYPPETPRAARGADTAAGKTKVKGAGKAGQAAEAAETAAENAGRAAKVANVAGKSIVVVGVTVDAGTRAYGAYTVEQDYKAGKITSQERTVAHAKNAAGAVGGYAGAYAGAEAGAFVGGAIGAFAGPLGAVAGGFVGGCIGGVAGYMGGDALGSEAAQIIVANASPAAPR